MPKTRLFFTAVYLLAFTSIAAAETVAESDLPFKVINNEAVYEVNNDGSYSETKTLEFQVLKESALASSKELSLSFSTSVASGQVLEAYTEKKSGERLHVPPGSYQVNKSGGYNNSSPLYSDNTDISVVLPQLAVGDLGVFKYRIDNKVGIFPGHFSQAASFNRFIATSSNTVRVIAPAEMKLYQASYKVTPVKPRFENGKQILEWRYSNPAAEKKTPADAGIVYEGDEPSIYVSTFADYQQIAKAYGREATIKAAVTPRILDLHQNIVGDQTDLRARAKALYEWVAVNISYGGNRIGVGTVVPRDLDVVLDNKMGDCKDHATLLQALLAAGGIASDQALINAEATYHLPSIPVVEAVNHVINYIPELDLFLDSTAATMPFGMVPKQLAEKPVLLVTDYRPGLKVPSTAGQEELEISRYLVNVRADGSASGTAATFNKGYAGAESRARLKDFPVNQGDELARKLLSAAGTNGSGTVELADASTLGDSYGFTINFKTDSFLEPAENVAFRIAPISAANHSIASYADNAYLPEPKRDTPCSAGTTIEEYEFHFDPAFSVLSLPKDKKTNGKYIAYLSSYRQEGTSILVRRVLVDKTPGNICSPAMFAEYCRELKPVLRDIKAQVFLQMTETADGD